MFVKEEWVTPNAEWRVARMTRGSNPPNQDNPEYRRLFEYCLIRNKPHWSPFQMANLCLWFETSLAVKAQIFRHWSMAICEPLDVQETSMRYMDPFDYDWGLQPIQLRKKAKRNRQSSEEPLNGEEFIKAQEYLNEFVATFKRVRDALKAMDVSNETLRMIYPQATTTRFFINGTCRSWIHYFQLRLDWDAQQEHREVAIEAFKVFRQHFPTVAEVLDLGTEIGVRSTVDGAIG